MIGPTTRPVFVDTSAWYATIDPNDPDYLRALRLLTSRPRLITTNFIVDETITLVLKRLGYLHALTLGESLWSGRLARLVYVSKADQRAAWDLFKRYDDKVFSFTDCTSFVVMERLGLLHAFAFDEHFEQVGRFVRVPR